MSEGAARVYRRKIRLVAEPGLATGGLAVGELADDAHHFRVRLEHDGEGVTDLIGEAVRFPWTTCAAAADALAPLRGMPLSSRSTAVGAHGDARANCTHLFDLAGLTVAQAARGESERLYECSVSDAEAEGETQATLARDGEPLLAWRVRDGVVRDSGGPCDGVALQGGFMEWAERELDEDLAEAVIVLRRAHYVSPVRFYDLDRYARAADVDSPPGRCYTYTDGTAQLALRMRGTHLDFSGRPEQLLPAAPAESARGVAAPRPAAGR